jgi:hypothetical protein
LNHHHEDAVSYKLVSVDDHLLEPPDLWISRMPSKHREDCMRLVRHDGVDVWSYEALLTDVRLQMDAP